MSTTPFSIFRFRLLFASCWVLWMFAHVMLLYWYHFPIGAAFLDSLISNGLLGAICILLTNMFRFYLPRKDRYGYLLALCIMFTTVWFFISRFLILFFPGEVPDYENFFALSGPVRLAIAFLIIGSMILISVLWYTQQEQEEYNKRQTEVEQLSRQAELFSLRQQLQPHFLFNSLNSINALVGASPTQARTMIQQLSDFLRGTLKRDNNQWVFLEEELNHLQLYLDIEMVRFGHRLKTNIQTNEGCNQLKIPSMLLQPIVENAIKFGLYDTTEEITINILVDCDAQNLFVSVSNPFDPSTHANKTGTGFGLSSVKRRLYLLFANQGLLETSTNESIFTTKITIPQNA